MNGLNKEENKSKNPLLQVPEVCPSCSRKYSHAKVNILKNKDSNILVHVTCGNCKTSVISNISINNVRIMAVGMLTDIEKKDLGLLKNEKMVSLDDVIDIHEIIEREGQLKLT